MIDRMEEYYSLVMEYKKSGYLKQIFWKGNFNE